MIEEQAQKMSLNSFPWETLYSLMVGEFGVAPSEYWQMTPAEISIILESKRPKHINGIHEDDISDMMRRRQELINQGAEVL